MKIVPLSEIQNLLEGTDQLPAITEAFRAYSAGRATVPPVGHLALDGGDCHIKYGHIDGQNVYVIKIASGFHGNPAIGLPPGNGCMMVFDARTGRPLALLQDEGWLTDLRTALAGRLAARLLAPADTPAIGILGTGVQARFQLEQLKPETACRRLLAWGRDEERLSAFLSDAGAMGFDASAASPQEIAADCRLIVTTTSADSPLLQDEWVQPGTHITAMGSDTPGKRELDPALVERADVLAVDSRSQCLDHGEFQHLESSGSTVQRLVELGDIIADPSQGRTMPGQISIADLTGVAVQDIAIAGAVWRAMA